MKCHRFQLGAFIPSLHHSKYSLQTTYMVFQHLNYIQSELSIPVRIFRRAVYLKEDLCPRGFDQLRHNVGLSNALDGISS